MFMYIHVYGKDELLRVQEMEASALHAKQLLEWTTLGLNDHNTVLGSSSVSSASAFDVHALERVVPKFPRLRLFC